jgi:DNA repair photolyase
MDAIYKPKGKAQEYSKLALNLYKGCAHACSYCYAPSATFCDRKLFSSDEYISVRKNILNDLEKQSNSKKFKQEYDGSPVLMSFTSDAYQPLEIKEGATKKALVIMKKAGIRPQILTKSGIEGITRDIDILKSTKSIWAVTLTTDSPEESLRWEPGAALPEERISSLKFAKKNGLETWVSFEPVFNPDAVIRLIEMTREYVDLYKVGKINYHPLSQTLDWGNFLKNVESTLGDHPRYIKKDLESYRPSLKNATVMRH